LVATRRERSDRRGGRAAADRRWVWGGSCSSTPTGGPLEPGTALIGLVDQAAGMRGARGARS
jgi:hypothetical protein